MTSAFAADRNAMKPHLYRVRSSVSSYRAVGIYYYQSRLSVCVVPGAAALPLVRCRRMVEQ
jgi:hypothetical protein